MTWLLRRTLVSFAHGILRKIEIPAGSQMWKRDIARRLLQTCRVTSYCSFDTFQYRKDTRIANSFGFSFDPTAIGAENIIGRTGGAYKDKLVGRMRNGCVTDAREANDWGDGPRCIGSPLMEKAFYVLFLSSVMVRSL